MVRRFNLKIPRARSRFTPQQQLNRQTPDYVDLTDPPELPDISLDIEELSTRFQRTPSAYNKKPTKSQRINAPTTPENWEYVQHRMMDEGRAIALVRHPRRTLVSVDDDVWEFGDYTKGGSSNSPFFKTVVVTWDGIGDPLEVMGVDYGSGNEGGTVQQSSNPLSSSTFGQFAPDPFVWAVFFTVNPDLNPPDDKWLPTPTNNPDWNALGIGATWVDYPL